MTTPPPARLTPRRWKTAILTWMGVYPLITFLIWALKPLLDALPIPLQTLVLSGLLVPMLVFAVLPLLSRWLRPWLAR